LAVGAFTPPVIAPSGGDVDAARVRLAPFPAAIALAIVLASGCGPTPSAPSSGDSSATTGPAAAARSSSSAPGSTEAGPVLPSPHWPVPQPATPVTGFEERTIHHETIHASVLVPKGARVSDARDPNGYPQVEIEVDRETVLLQFDSGIGALGPSLAKTPPTVYGLATEMVTVGPDAVAARYRDSRGNLRILGIAPGVKCKLEPVLDVPAATLDKVYTVCASLRSPPPGAWRAATAEERSHGGMTAVPAGAWVEGSLPATAGSLLRPGRFKAQMHVAGMVVAGGPCPSSFEGLSDKEPNEIDVHVEKRTASGGDVWIRKAVDRYDGASYPGATTVLSPRAGGCCRVGFIPWTTPPSAAAVDYAVALCETFQTK